MGRSVTGREESEHAGLCWGKDLGVGHVHIVFTFIQILQNTF